MPVVAEAEGPGERGWSEVDAAFTECGVKLLDVEGEPADHRQSGIPAKFLLTTALALKEFVPQVTANSGLNTVPLESIAGERLGSNANVTASIQGERGQVGANWFSIRENLKNPACGRIQLSLAERTDSAMVFKLQFGSANLPKDDEKLKNFRMRVRLA